MFFLTHCVLFPFGGLGANDNKNVGNAGTTGWRKAAFLNYYMEGKPFKIIIRKRKVIMNKKFLLFTVSIHLGVSILTKTKLDFLPNVNHCDGFCKPLTLESF